MKKKLNSNENENASVESAGLDERALQKKWGVSAEQLRDAVANVGYNRSHIEEYLVNKKWQQHGDFDANNITEPRP